MKDIFNFKGEYLIEAIDVRTGEIVQETRGNVVVQNFFTGIFRFLNHSTDTPAADSLNLSHLAIGTGLNTAMKADTTLQTETFRKAIATKTYNATVMTCKTAIAASEGNPGGGYVTEVGIFAKATDTANSGTLISRANVNIQKNSNIKLNVWWYLTGA